MIKFVIQALAFMTLLSDLVIAHLVILYILEKLTPFKQFTAHKKRLQPYAFYLIFAVTMTATLGSLFFSEVAKFTPCLLCWYQRIFMYPQPLLVYAAILREERVIKPYLFILNFIGGCISLYHVIIQQFPKLNITPCDVTGVSCTRVYAYYFGYITIPMMALTAFVLNLILLQIMDKAKK